MALYIQGYDKERFVSTVNRNFICLICFNVLKDPVLCPKNQHCFCRGCVTKHLENAKRCPTCAVELTVVDTLTEAPTMIKVMLNELNIRCVYIDRGCQEILQLQHLGSHEATCGFTPAVCTNQGCGATVNQRDLIYHESEVCEFRKLKCHSCEEMTKTLANMDKRMANMETTVARRNLETKVGMMETKLTNVEKNMADMKTVVEGKFESMSNEVTGLKTALEKITATNTGTVVTTEKNIQTNVASIEKRIANVETNVVAIETKLAIVEKNMADMKIDIEGKFKTVDKKVTGLKTALIEGFNELKDVLLQFKQENTKVVRNRPSGDREIIIVAGGHEDYTLQSVEMFNWREKTWSQLQSMPQKRSGATSFVYNNHVTITGGSCHPGYFDDMIRMNVEAKPNLSIPWSDCPFKMPTGLARHSSVLYNDQLLVTGGYDANLRAASDCIHAVQLVPPYNVNILSRMPEPRQNHTTQIFEDSLLIVGGTTTLGCKDNLSRVVRYNIKTKEWKQLAPIPYDVSSMASVKWGDNIVVIGGVNKDNRILDTVIIYNVKTEQSHMLPPMKVKRCGCTAVVVRNHIVVLGGTAGCGTLKSVEAFNFESNTWQGLPEMFQSRYLHTAVAV